MTTQSLFQDSVDGLRQPLLLSLIFTAMLVPLFGFLGDWGLGFLYGAIPLFVLGAMAAPLAVAAARRKYRIPTVSLPSLKAGLFAGVWASFWLVPFNVVIYLRHGHALSTPDNLIGLASVAATAFLLSLLPAES